MSSRNLDLAVQVRQNAPFPLDAGLECRAGQLMALVGPSGSGKSTLLRMIAGLVRVQQGHIRSGDLLWADGRRHVTAQQRRVGYVPQHYGLFPHMHALGNVETALHHLPAGERSRIAHEWLERVHLGGLAKRRPAELSGGQQQRVALARALAASPRVLLLDEPFSAVDAATREKLYTEIVELRSGLAMPVVLVTHDLQEALMLADRITLLSQGRTLQSGEPKTVLSHPVSEDAAMLLGLRNIFESVVLEQDGADAITALDLAGHRIEIPRQPHLRRGDRVSWVIADAGIRFRAISRKEIAPQTNRLPVTVVKMLTMGDQVRLFLQLADTSVMFRIDVTARLAEELALDTGIRTEVVLRAADIHVFEQQVTGRPG
ncbi:MAG: hypothetical protein RL194_1204 [Pseudomonadota bacterium]